MCSVICKNITLAKYKKGRNWIETAKEWLTNQPEEVVMFFVQFKDIEFASPPRMYLARANEVANHLLRGRSGNASTCLLENYSYKKGIGKETTDKMPDSWVCSEERINTV